MKPRINIIAAVCTNKAIGRKGELLFRISDDLKRFKALTMGHPIIMGRKTFESFPKGPLPGRRNIVITRQSNYAPEGAEVVGSPAQAIELCKDCDEVFIIGGGEIYKEFINSADALFLTEIDATPTDADAFFPDFSGKIITETSEWIEDSPRYRFVNYS